MNTTQVTKASVGLRNSQAVRGVSLPKLKCMQKVCNRRQVVKTQALSDANVVVSGCTAGMLFIGRYAFLPFQRAKVEQAGMPVQNDETHLEAGDRLAEEATFVLQTKDPAGFNLVDLLAWGSLGHALAYAVLGVSSLN
eukprot:CAMPEP_0197846970 /NCGR_PEP_ID=MMETSP1438-20131217/4772_1 /TAXON_ID=1461541 /ORGANISM="Pterosperma sp., Strain CCMP1384" /LENGTH=137 /DNA_ID=CAMNT_0043458761 /DNA_START=79 /DNA_END=492 /DNA_ORIENTATION=+